MQVAIEELERLADRLLEIHSDALFDEDFDLPNGPAAQHFMAGLSQIQLASSSMKLAMYALGQGG